MFDLPALFFTQFSLPSYARACYTFKHAFLRSYYPLQAFDPNLTPPLSRTPHAATRPYKNTVGRALMLMLSCPHTNNAPPHTHTDAYHVARPAPPRRSPRHSPQGRRITPPRLAICIGCSGLSGSTIVLMLALLRCAQRVGRIEWMRFAPMI